MKGAQKELEVHHQFFKSPSLVDQNNRFFVWNSALEFSGLDRQAFWYRSMIDRQSLSLIVTPLFSEPFLWYTEPFIGYLQPKFFWKNLWWIQFEKWRFYQECKNLKKRFGDAGYRSRYLSHAKRALYHLSYTPLHLCLIISLYQLSTLSYLMKC